MANRYWVGGTDNWNGTAGLKWSDTSGGPGGASVPTAADDVFFDANSGPDTVTIALGNTGAKSINCTGFVGTITGTASIVVSGSITLVAGMAWTHSVAVTISGTGTLTTAGQVFSPTTINGSGATVTLGDALNIFTRALSVTQGTFNTAGFSITAGTFSSTGSLTRAINLSSSTITLSTLTNTINLVATNLTFNAGTSTFNLSNSGAQIVGGGQTFYNVNFTSATGGTKTISGSNTFNNLTVTPPSSTGQNFLTFSGNQTISDTFTCAGATAIRRFVVTSDTRGTTRTLAVATLSGNDCDFRDIAITGPATGTAPTRAGNCGGNSGITFFTKTVYWNLAAGGNWSATGWAATSGASPAVTNFPLAQDTAVVEATGLNTGATITIDAAWNIGSVNLSARTTNTVTIATSTNNPLVYGNWISGTGVTFTGTGTITFGGHNSQTITNAGTTWTQNITIDSSNSVTLLDAILSTRTITLTRGTFDANIYNVTISSAGTFNSSGTNARTLAIGSGTWTIIAASTSWTTLTSTNLTVTGTGTISMTSGSAKAFAGGSTNYGGITLNNGGAGALTISGSNRFKALSNSVRPTTFTFIAGITTTIEQWEISGAPGNLVTIGSATAASHTISKATGFVRAKYISISRSTATGGATWQAYFSTDGLNNTGWTFSGNTFLASRLTSTGNLLTNVDLDEVTSLGAGVATRTDINNLYAVEFDEVTLNPISAGLARRITSSGSYRIAGEFDENTGIS